MIYGTSFSINRIGDWSIDEASLNSQGPPMSLSGLALIAYPSFTMYHSYQRYLSS